MESLKQFRVNFQVTFWCEGRKGIFSKKPYKFTVSFRDDIMLSTFLINARTEKEAVKTMLKIQFNVGLNSQKKIKPPANI